MERHADVYGIGLSEKGKQAFRRSAGQFGRVLIGCLGAVLSNAALPGGAAPFGIAFAAAASGAMAVPAAVGAAMGYVLYFASDTGVNWMGLLGIVLAEWIVWGGHLTQNRRRKGKARQDMQYRLLGAVFGTAAPQLLVALFIQLTVQDLFSLLSEATAALGACWMFTRLSGTKAAAEPGTLLMTAGLAAAALSHICIYDVSLGRIGALVIVLLAADSFGGKGAAAGIGAGALTALCGVQKSIGYMLPGIWGVGGLLAGIFAPLGSGALCAALLLGELAAVFLFAQEPQAYVILPEALAAGVLYLLLPVQLRCRCRNLIGSDRTEQGRAAGTVLFTRLQDTREALLEIAEVSDAAAKYPIRGEKPFPETPEQLFREVIGSVCRSCPNGAKCWAGSYDETLEGFGRLRQHLRSGEALTAETAEACFVKGCIRPEAIAEQAQQQYRLALEREQKQHLRSRSRCVVTDQFEGLSMILAEMERELRETRSCDRETAETARACLVRNRLELRSLRCTADAAGRLTLEAVLPIGQRYRLENGGESCTEELTRQLSMALLREFAPPKIDAEGTRIRICWQEQPRFRLITGSAQQSAEEGKVCGDVVSVFSDPKHRELLLISDGMGTGVSAAMDSALTAGILSKLLRAGVGPEAALRLVNSALLSRTEESLATVDLAQVDLYTGSVRFHKAGAAPTYLCRNGEGGSVEAVSLPAGILQTVFAQAEVMLHTGDRIVMVSDGAVQGNGDWIPQELERSGIREPARLAQHLLRCALAHTEGRADDITVLVGQLSDA